MPPGSDPIQTAPFASIATALTLSPPMPVFCVQTRGCEPDCNRTSPRSVPTQSAPEEWRRMAHTMLLLRPSSFVQFVHSPDPRHLARPDPHTPTHNDPSRS